MFPTDERVDPNTGVEAYMLNYFKALTTLEQAADELKEQAEDGTLPESDQARAAAAYLDMNRAIAHLKAAHETILDTYSGRAEPPPADLVDRSLALSRALADDLAAAHQAVAVLQVATSFVNGWAGLLGAAPAAPATAAGMRAAVAPPRHDPAANLQVERTIRATNMEFLGLGRR